MESRLYINKIHMNKSHFFDIIYESLPVYVLSVIVSSVGIQFYHIDSEGYSLSAIFLSFKKQILSKYVGL